MNVANKGEVSRPFPGAMGWIFGLRTQVVLVFALSFLLYSNTFKHEHALDDSIVIVGNEYVHKGTAGLSDIFGKDTYFSYYDRLHTTNQLAGGRYRPLSVATFALEQQLFGPVAEGEVDSLIAFGVGYKAELPYEKKFFHEMHVRHIVNVLLYALAVVALLFFFRFILFRDNPTAAFVAALLFAVHPIHTEVVANVKSRDEILSLLFICLTFLSFHRYHLSGKRHFLLGSAFAFLLALLSKEYAATLLVLLPLCWYVCYGFDTRRIVKETLPFIAVFLFYGLLRWNAVGLAGSGITDDIQTNPYAFASAGEKAATIISTSLRYIRLLSLPYPLSADYSYAQIPYTTFSDPIVWLSAFIHLGLVVGLVFFTIRRSIWAIAIAFYLLNLLLVNNFLFDIGATMGERLIFHSSVGFVVAIVLAAQWVMAIFNTRGKIVVPGTLTVVAVVLCASMTYNRNRYWKNDATLFMKDIEVCPNSFLVNENVGSMLVNMSDFEPDERIRNANLHRAVGLFSHVLTMKNDYVMGRANRAIAYLKLGSVDSMVADLEIVRQLYPIYPSLPQLYYHAAMLSRQQANLDKSVAILHTAAGLVPGDVALSNIVRQVEAEADSLRNVAR